MDENNEKMDKLNLLTLEAGMLWRVLYDALSVYGEQDGICEICYLSEILDKKFSEIRAIFKKNPV